MTKKATLHHVGKLSSVYTGVGLQGVNKLRILYLQGTLFSVFLENLPPSWLFVIFLVQEG